MATCRSALRPLNLDFPVFLTFDSPRRALLFAFGISDFFVLVLVEAGRRTTTFSDWKRDRDIDRRSPLFHIAIARNRTAVECVEGRLASDVSGAGRSLRRNLNVPIYNRLTTIGRESLVRYLGRCRLVEEVCAAARRTVETLFLAEAFAFHHRRTAHRRRTAAVDVLVDVNVATASGVSVVLLVAEMVVVVAASASLAPSASTSTSTLTPHALKSVAIPSLAATTAAATRWLVETAEIPCGGAIH